MSKKTFKLEAEFIIEEGSNDVEAILKEYKDAVSLDSDRFASPLNSVIITEIETKKYGKTKAELEDMLVNGYDKHPIDELVNSIIKEMEA